MPKVISIHEYILKPGLNEEQFEKAVLAAQERGLLELPGLVDYYLVKGIRGFRNGLYAAIWGLGDVLHIFMFCLRDWVNHDRCLTCQDSHD
jgi:hypothetical protein